MDHPLLLAAPILSKGHKSERPDCGAVSYVETFLRRPEQQMDAEPGASYENMTAR